MYYKTVHATIWYNHQSIKYIHVMAYLLYMCIIITLEQSSSFSCKKWSSNKKHYFGTNWICVLDTGPLENNYLPLNKFQDMRSRFVFLVLLVQLIHWLTKSVIVCTTNHFYSSLISLITVITLIWYQGPARMTLFYQIQYIHWHYDISLWNMSHIVILSNLFFYIFFFFLSLHNDLV